MKEFSPDIIRKYRKELLSAEQMTELSSYLIGQIKGRCIIIYGAGAAGKQIAEALFDADVKVEAFVDKKALDIGTAIGIRVLLPEQLEEYRSREVLVIIAVDPQIFKNSSLEIEANIKKYYREDCEVISYGRDLLYILRYAVCKSKIARGCKINLIDCLNCGAESRGCDLFLDYLKSETMTEMRDDLRQDFIPYFGYIVGQKCTLRCRDCCELVPYYEHGEIVSKEEILGDCKKLASASRFTMYIELVGGEPFLHPDIAEILEELLEIKNVGYVKVFTNGTVCPSDKLIEILKNPRIVLMWSNYTHAVSGRLLENISRTRKKLEENGVKYIYSHAETWLDFSRSFDLSNKDEEKLKRDFDDCHIADCLRLHKGTLYRCPHHYAGIQLGKLEKKNEECVELNEIDDVIVLSEKLYEFRHLPYIDACKHCKLPYDAEEVPAAIQLTSK